MKALILAKRHRLRHILVRLPCLLSAFPSHKQAQAVVVYPMVTNLLYLPLFLAGLEFGVISHLNGPGSPPREMLGDRGPR